MPGCCGAGTAERSYPASEVRGGGREETPHVQGQGQQGEATSHPRPGVVTLRSHPKPEARGSSWEEPPTPEASASGREEQIKGAVAEQAQEGLEELSHVEGQERQR